MEKQQTLRGKAVYSGITLHTGVRATLKINPAPENTGIWFRRVDVTGTPSVRAVASNVVDVRRGTTISGNGATVGTVEHIMASLHACGVDNAIVDMDGPEPPILDGSAREYFAGIIATGLEEQSAEAAVFRPSAPIHVNGGHTQMVIAPHQEDSLRVFCTTSFAGCPFDPQFMEIEITRENFEKEIAPARTFVAFDDLRQLLSMGLIRGGSLDNAAIMHGGAIFCKEKLLWQNEIVRHKILDITGDLFLCGKRVRGCVIAVKPGHPRNVELATAMMAQDAKS
ncbi:MAG: UDP-3-O-acyl-N-acetylglucosamine deacetylase [Victivallaceae bacterium]|nr:UDP-3-O-acyl-N-acetylglucosamine deacetylase [Victivallaceae bacterium]